MFQDAEAMRELLKDAEEGEERNSVPEAQRMGHPNGHPSFGLPFFLNPGLLKKRSRARFLFKCVVSTIFFGRLFECVWPNLTIG